MDLYRISLAQAMEGTSSSIKLAIESFIKDKCPLQYMIDCVASISEFRCVMVIHGYKEDCLSWLELFKETYPIAENDINLLINNIDNEDVIKRGNDCWYLGLSDIKVKG